MSREETEAFASEPIDTESPTPRLSPLCALCVSSSALPGPRAPSWLLGPHSCEKDTTLDVRLDARRLPLSEWSSPMIARSSGPKSLRARVSRLAAFSNPRRSANAAPCTLPLCSAPKRLLTPRETARAAIFPSCSRDHWSSNTSLATGGGMIEHASILCAWMAFADFSWSMVMRMTPLAVTPIRVAT